MAPFHLKDVLFLFFVAFVVCFNFCTVSKETVCVCCLSLVIWIKRNKVTCL